MKVPLAEHFHSLQGEGTWVGTPMHFIRLAGCSVGKLASGIVTSEGMASPVPLLPTGKPAWACKAFDGTPFWCDTDFNKHEEVELEALLEETWEDHICITGGEPLIHRDVITEFYNRWAGRAGERGERYRIVHVETSGTIPFMDTYRGSDVWFTVSPKIGYISDIIVEADELKLLISTDTKDDFPLEFLRHRRVFLSPINNVSQHGDKRDFDYVSDKSLKRCQELLRAHPSWRLSIQLHKYLGLR